MNISTSVKYMFAAVACVVLVGCSSKTDFNKIKDVRPPAPKVNFVHKAHLPESVADLDTIVIDGQSINLTGGKQSIPQSSSTSENKTYDLVASDSDGIKKRVYHTSNQRFGAIQKDNITHVFSQGNVTPIDNIPQQGTAIYTGRVTGINLSSGEQIDNKGFASAVDFGKKTISMVIPLERSVSADIVGNRFSRIGDIRIQGQFYGNNAQSLGGTVETQRFAGAFSGEKVTQP